MGISLSNKSIRDPLVCPLGKTQCLLGIVNMCILELYPDPIYHWSTIRCLARYRHFSLFLDQKIVIITMLWITSMNVSMLAI